MVCNLIDKYKKLIQAFKTSTNLSVELCYHNTKDNGSCYDDVDGYFWSVDGTHTLTIEGERCKDYLTTIHFVTYG